MCFTSKKKRLRDNRKSVDANAMQFDILCTIAQDDADLSAKLRAVQVLLEKLVPSDDKRVVRIDGKLEKRIARLRKVLTKESKRGVYKRSRKLLREIEIAAVERGCVNRAYAPCDEKDFVIEDGVLVRYVGAGGVVVLPHSVTTVGPKAFSANEAIRELICNDGLLMIGESAFEHCRALRSVTLTRTVTTIDDSAFYNCSALTSVLTEEGLTNISHYAFGKCPALSAFRLPKSVVRIGDKAFFLDKNLPKKARKKIKKISSKALG